MGIVVNINGAEAFAVCVRKDGPSAWPNAEGMQRKCQGWGAQAEQLGKHIVLCKRYAERENVVKQHENITMMDFGMAETAKLDCGWDQYIKFVVNIFYVIFKSRQRSEIESNWLYMEIRFVLKFPKRFVTKPNLPETAVCVRTRNKKGSFLCHSRSFFAVFSTFFHTRTQPFKRLHWKWVP